MNNTLALVRRKLFVSASLILASAVVFLGAIVLFGWFIHAPSIVQIHVSFVPMQFNTALGFLFSGLALFFQIRGRKIASRVFAIITCLIGALTLFQYITGVELGIDELFMTHDITVKTSHPGRMAPNTALCFTLVGIVVLGSWMRVRAFSEFRLSDILATLVVCLGLVAFFGYISSLETAYGWGNLTRMALHTSFGFILLGLGCSLTLLKQNPPSIRDSKRLEPIRAFIACLVVFVLFWQAAESYEAKSLTNITREKANSIREIISMQVSERHASLRRSLYRYQSGGYSAQESWVDDMESYILDYAALESVVLIDTRLDRIWSAGRQYTESTFAEILDLSEGRSGYSALLKDELGKSLLVIMSSTNSGDLRLLMVHDHNTFKKGQYSRIASNTNATIFDRREGAAVAAPNGYRFDFPTSESGQELSILIEFTEEGKSFHKTWLSETILFMGFLLAIAVYYGLRLTFQNREIAQREEKAYRVIEESEKRLNAIIKATPIGIALVDNSDSIRLANGAMSQIFGYDETEFAAMKFAVLVPNAKGDKDVENSEGDLQAPTHRSMSPVDLFGLRKDGSKVDIEVGLSPVSTEDGVFSMATVIDVSERKELEKVLQVKNEELLYQRDEMEQLVYIVSHDLKSPLVTIQGFATLLQTLQGSLADEDAQTNLRRIIKASKHMGGLIGDILEISRIGRIEDRFEEVNVGEVIDELSEILEVERLNNKCEWIRKGEFPVLRISRNRIFQILQNLIGNALKYGCNQTINTIEIEAAMKDGQFLLSVRDFGTGISEGEIDKVFTPFYATKGEKAGTGVGLAIVRKIAKFYEGQAWVESEYGKGCKFTVSLPAKLVVEAVAENS